MPSVREKISSYFNKLEEKHPSVLRQVVAWRGLRTRDGACKPTPVKKGYRSIVPENKVHCPGPKFAPWRS
jgi:hypothetical protein